MIRAGQLRHLVTLQKPFKTTSDDGQIILNFVDVENVKAKIFFKRGREYILSREQHAEISAVVTMRFRPNVTRAWRILYGTRILNIVDAIDVGDRGRELELMCTEELA